MKLQPSVKECLTRIGRRWRLHYTVLYGSRARGYAGPHSDYDVAVKAGRTLGLVERGLLLGDLEECLGGRVDLVLVDDWDPIIVWEALAKGVLVYADGVNGLREYYDDLTLAIDEVADLEPLIKLFEGEARSALARTSGKNIESA